MTRIKKSEGHPSTDQTLRHWFDWLLAGGGAHADFNSSVRGMPAKLRGVKAGNLPHSAWQLLEHMCIAQFDILDFSRNPKYKSRLWPDTYWPKSRSPRSGEWE